MVEQDPDTTMKPMSRGGFMGNLMLLAGALGLGLLDLTPVIRQAASPSEPPNETPEATSPGPRPDGRPRIMTPTGSVKRRG